jgi:hypothetical protein
VGFDVVRVRVGGRESVRINPVWIPSLARPEETAAYTFDDPYCGVDRGYVYRIEGITSTGLVSPSEACLSKPLRALTGVPSPRSIVPRLPRPRRAHRGGP